MAVEEKDQGMDEEGEGAAACVVGSRCGRRMVHTTRHFTQCVRKSNQSKGWERGREGIRGGQEKPLR